MRHVLKAALAAVVLSCVWSFPAMALEAPEGDEIADGIYVEDIALGGMTKQEARAALDQYFSEQLQVPVGVTFGGTAQADGSVETDKRLDTTLEALGLTWSNPDVLDGVEHVGKRGNLLDRYKQLKDLQEKKLVFEMEYTMDEAAVESFIRDNAPQFNEPTVEATITKYGNRFEVTPSAVGMEVDLDSTLASVRGAIAARESKEPVKVAGTVKEVAPRCTEEALSTIQYQMGSQETTYGGIIGRIINVELGASLINGTVIMPGETWSANATMEPYTPERGWQKGASYTGDGGVEYTYGGGVCQLATTLYVSAVKAEVGIAQRNPHSMIVGYLPYSQDAAIAGDWKDLKLRNDYDFPIYIEGWGSNGVLHFAIWGAQPGRDVRLRSETLSFTPQEVIYKDDPSLPFGKLEKEFNGYPAVRSAAYKQVFVNGELVEETLLSEDSYLTSPDIYRRGTGPAETEAPPETEAPDVPVDPDEPAGEGVG